jgi:hypothetical protein
MRAVEALLISPGPLGVTEALTRLGGGRVVGGTRPRL